ncbi:STAS domain-containing protein [Actinophytocola glycyrrhizae]|uniref:Anti-sigma factor antagonist n=1 Tax=Actinophytocola glycyrrhizae TaxID=2044873 RepID=A0ABV9RTG6_9PSEU
MTDQPGLRIDTRRIDDAVVVDVAGEVDLDTAPRLREAIAVAIDEAGSGTCVVDLTDVPYLGSSGLSALLDANREAAARQAPLRIVVDANRPVIRPIEITGLDQVLHLYHSVEEALDAAK